MDSRRQNKVGTLLQEELAQLFQRESKNLFNGAFITVTQVRVAPDLSVARVFLSIMGKDKEKVMANVKEQNKEIRKRLAEIIRFQLRKTPELIFVIDDSLDYAEKINNLLKK
jgi:ribosome-binding factor A